MNIQSILKATDASSGSSAAAGTTAGASTTASSSATSDAADRFLKLLVTQLQNQDPLNPLDNAEVTTQLAQISTVTGINQLNDTMSALGAAMSVSQVMQAASLVGHDVVVSGNNVDIASDGTAQGGIELAGAADHVMVTVSDDAGNVVRTMDLGAQKAGDQFFTWDGKNDTGAAVPAGHYTFSATATAGGKAVTFDTLMTVRVEGVVSTSAGAMLQLPGGSQIDFADIKQIH